MEPLEGRQLLSAAPVAVDDAYDLGPDGRIAVDVTTPSPIPEDPLPPPPAFDEARWVEPTGPWATPDFVKTVEGGQVVIEPDWVEVGDRPGNFGEVTVRNPGSRWVVSNWLELGQQGKGTASVSDGGAINVRNWTTVGADGGLGTVTVTGATSRWISNNHFTVGYGNGWGTVRLLDRAQMTVNGSPATASSGFIDVGDRGGRGLVEILEGSALRHNDWIEVGNNGGRGDVRVAGGGLLATSNFTVVGNNGGLGTVDVSGAGSRWTVGNHFTVGANGGRGIVTVSGGALVQSSNWAEIGRDARSSGRVIVTGDGSRFVVSNWMDVGNGGGAGTLFVGEGATAEVRPTVGEGGTPATLRNHAAGRILGSGTLRGGQMTNWGFVSPGGSTGVLTLVGTLDQPAPDHPARGPGGTLHFDIGGTQRGAAYDGLDVSGAVSVTGGKIVLNFVNGFAPKAGDRFTLIDGGATTTASPRTVEVRGLAPGFNYSLAVEGNDLVLVANNDGASAPVTVQRNGVLANDTDADGDRLTAILVDRPNHGTVTLFADGSFTYVAGPTFTGTDTFQYKADDGLHESNVATVTLRRPTPPPNEPPVARPDHKATRENRTLTFPAADLTANDSDPDRGDTLTVTAVSGSADTHGNVTLQDGTITYIPDRNYRGPAAFTYTVSDGNGGTATGTVNVTVQGRQRGTAGTAVGRGSLNDRRRTFSFMISSRVTGKGDEVLIRGTLSYEDKQSNLVLRAVGFTVFELDRPAKKATVAGTATVNGRSGYRFEATIEDRSASGSNDRFRIKITGPEDFAYDSNNGSRNGDRIDRGGSIVLTDSKGPITAALRA